MDTLSIILIALSQIVLNIIICIWYRRMYKSNQKIEDLEAEVCKLKEENSKIEKMETKLKTMEHEIVSLQGLLLANENRRRNLSASTDITNFEKIADRLDSMHTTLRLIYYNTTERAKRTEETDIASCFLPQDDKLEL